MPEALLEKSLIAHLALDSDITDLVEGNIYPGKKPAQNSGSSITYWRISTERIAQMEGATGMVRSRIQLSSWAQGDNGFMNAMSIANELRLKLDNFSGTLGGVFAPDSQTYTTTVDAIHLDGESDVFHATLVDDNNPGIYGVRQDYLVRHREELDENT